MITQGLLVELLVDGTWTDITSRVMVRDTGGQITISRGQSAEGQAPDPGTATFQLNNRNGLFSPENPLSAYYGLIGRNSQVRISVTRSDGTRSYRFWGEVPAWPEDWDMSGNDVWVDVEAAGVLRRLGQGNQPLESTLRRRVPTDADVVGYWPLEDGKTALTAASALSTGTPMVVTGLAFTEDDSLAGSGPLPTITDGARLYAKPIIASTGEFRVECVFKIPTAPAAGSPVFLSFSTTTEVWTVTVSSTAVAFTATNRSGTVVASGSTPTTGFFGQWNRFSVYASTSAPSVSYNLGWLSVDAPESSFGGVISGSYFGTLAPVTTINTVFGTGLGGSTVGHYAVFSQAISTAFDGADNGFDGEYATARIERLCAEQNVSFTSAKYVSVDPMGPQSRSSYTDLVRECLDVDGGILAESPDALGFTYTSRTTLYNQGAALTLSYPGHQLSDIPRPNPDDQRTRNDVTASSPSGTSARYTQPDGPLSVAAVGTYPDAVTLNVHSDGMLFPRAAWRAHLGTTSTPRYPAISVNLANEAMDPLRDAVLDLRFGNRIVVTDPPSRLGGDISQLVIGSQETLTFFEHQLTFVGVPADPYVVAVVGDAVLGRVDSAGSRLAAGATGSATALSVAVTGGALWRTTTVNYPLDLLIAGEVVTVTAVSGSSSPQTFTVIRGVNGITKPLPVGAPVHLATPAIVAL